MAESIQQTDVSLGNGAEATTSGLANVPGIGPKRIAALKAAGIETRQDLAGATVERLVDEFGMQPAYAARALESVRGAAPTPKPPARRGRPPGSKNAAVVAEVPTPARRGRRPAAEATAADAPTPVRRGRKPAGTTTAETPTPARRGRKPAATETDATPPVRRGRRPAVAATNEEVKAPARRGRPPRVAVAAETTPEVVPDAAPDTAYPIAVALEPEVIEAAMETEAPSAPEAEPVTLTELDRAERALRTAIADVTRRFSAIERPLVRLALLLDKLPVCAGKLSGKKQGRLAKRLEELAILLEKAAQRKGGLSAKREGRLREQIREDRRALADVLSDAEARGSR